MSIGRHKIKSGNYIKYVPDYLTLLYGVESPQYYKIVHVKKCTKTCCHLRKVVIIKKPNPYYKLQERFSGIYPEFIATEMPICEQEIKGILTELELKLAQL